jgi:hypothetical protein
LLVVSTVIIARSLAEGFAPADASMSVEQPEETLIEE